jgi:hypothetical protein
VADREDGERLRLVRHHTEYHRHDREARLPDGLVDLLGHRNGARQGEDVRIAARTISALELDVRDGVRPPADGLIAALEGTTFKSPRGAVCLRCRTYNVVQDIYIRPVETTGAAASNVVVDTIPKVARSG